MFDKDTYLAPCPMCGCTDISVKKYDPYDGYLGDCTLHKVYCPDCSLQIDRVEELDARVAWNRREKKVVYRGSALPSSATDEFERELKESIKEISKDYAANKVDFSFHNGAESIKTKILYAISEIAKKFREGKK